MTISGRNISLRLAEPVDAGLIFALRKSPRGRHLSPIADDPRLQEEWIRDYKSREIRGEELYFIIKHKTAGDVGALRLYAIAADSFWWGSWIVREGAPGHAAPESMFLVYELGFFRMGLARACFVVRRDNPSLGFHPKVGARAVEEDAVRVVFELTRESYLPARARLARRFGVSSRSAACNG